LGHTGRRLVEEHDGRVLSEHAGQLDDPTGPGRQVGDRDIGEPTEADLRRQNRPEELGHVEPHVSFGL
jgi:hypothetical protein